MGKDKKSLERLLKLAQSHEVFGVVEGNNEAHTFCLSNNIHSGKTKIPTFIIYYTYIKWCKRVEKIPIDKRNFFKELNKMYPKKRSNQYRYYLLNDVPFNLTEEGIAEAKNYMLNTDKSAKEDAKTSDIYNKQLRRKQRGKENKKKSD